jgi:hypothetical protein
MTNHPTEIHLFYLLSWRFTVAARPSSQRPTAPQSPGLTAQRGFSVVVSDEETASCPLGGVTGFSDRRIGVMLDRLERSHWIKSRRDGGGGGLCHGVKDELLLGNEMDTWQPGFIIDFEFC